MALGVCKNCNKEKQIALSGKSEGLCNGCYNSVFNLENIKKANYRKWHNIDLETYRKLTGSCVICGFNKIVELHHLDHNKKTILEIILLVYAPTTIK